MVIGQRSVLRPRRLLGPAVTKATGTSPSIGSGRPTTATSRTPNDTAQHPLDLRRTDVLAAHLENVLVALDEGQRTGLPLQRTRSPVRNQPSSAKAPRRWLSCVPEVLGEQRDAALASHQQFAGLAGEPTVLVIHINDGDSHTPVRNGPWCPRRPGGARLPYDRVGDRLGHPELADGPARRRWSAEGARVALLPQPRTRCSLRRLSMGRQRAHAERDHGGPRGRIPDRDVPEPSTPRSAAPGGTCPPDHRLDRNE